MSRVDNPANDVDVDLGKLFSSLVRDWKRIVFVALGVTLVAFLLASFATPLYRAETRLSITSIESAFTRPQETGPDSNSPNLDERGIASAVQEIQSDSALKEVAKTLNLASRHEFDKTADPSFLSQLLITLGLKSDPSEIAPEDRVLKTLRDKVEVYVLENSRVIGIQATSEDPQLAAQIAQAVAKEYLRVQQAVKLESSTDATKWLEPEIADLSKRVKDAEARVADFRSKSDLLVGQNNSVLATQQLSEISTELSRVRANRAAAEAKALSVRKIIDSGASLDAMPDVMASGLIQRLRERQVQLNTDIADLSTTLLDNHPRIRALRSQLSDLDEQIRREARNILRSLNNEAETAKLREQELVGDLNRTKADSARAGEQEVELRALEREAAAQRDLLESYLSRYREASSRQDRKYLPVDARISSEATVPDESYFPKVIPITAAAFVASLLVMAVITLLRELFSGRAMSAAPGARVEPVARVRVTGKEFPWTVDAPEEPRVVRTIATAETLPEAPVAERPVHRSVLGEVGIETAAENLIAGGASRAIFVSPEGDEAAASAVMVAREVADAGLRVLLLDLTASGAASRPMLDSVSYPGITNLLCSESQFSDVIHTDNYSDCHVIPVGTANPARAMRAVDRLPIIMESLTTAYDVVIVECGPTDAEGIRRLTAGACEVLVSMIEADDAVVAETATALREHGYGELTLVTPAGYQPPVPTMPGRSAA